jgi:uncharacterized protein YbjQ (UPF0145 family)
VRLFDWLASRGAWSPSAPTDVEAAREAASARRQADILSSLERGRPPSDVSKRLQDAASGVQPWIATLTAAEMLVLRSRGLKPISAVSATCWLNIGWSWSLGHSEGWSKAVERLQAEAAVGGANAVVDVKMKTIKLPVDQSMDFTLIGTAVRVEGLPPSPAPVIATVSALEFVKLLESDIVPTGVAVGAHYEWLVGGWGPTLIWSNGEYPGLSEHMRKVRGRAYEALRDAAKKHGAGVLAHTNLSEMLLGKLDEGVLARHVVVATTVDCKRAMPIPHEIKMMIDMAAGVSPLKNARHKHESSHLSDRDGAI